MAELNEITVQPEDYVQITAPGLAPAYFEVHRNDNGRVHVRPVDDDTQEGVIYRGPSGLMVQGSNMRYEIEFWSPVDYAVIVGDIDMLRRMTDRLGRREAALAFNYNQPAVLEFMKNMSLPLSFSPLELQDLEYLTGSLRYFNLLKFMVENFGISGFARDFQRRTDVSAIDWEQIIDEAIKTNDYRLLNYLVVDLGWAPDLDSLTRIMTHGDVKAVKLIIHNRYLNLYNNDDFIDMIDDLQVNGNPEVVQLLTEAGVL